MLNTVIKTAIYGHKDCCLSLKILPLTTIGLQIWWLRPNKLRSTLDNQSVYLAHIQLSAEGMRLGIAVHTHSTLWFP